ncbi:RAMP superfamily CRISPR-associated protein [Microcoleus sp. B4-D4]|uniref:RAMP superfamily CRISPR-associated protein n=1 Tax=Microcoleus sp. B4-D4 TaxID=2818667 RepID=UPI002FD17750
MAEYQITIKMESDWHIGSGTGQPGNIDRLVKRDAADLPFIPAKTLTGIWRDACEQVAWSLDGGGTNNDWQKWVDYLFGEQPALPQEDGNSPLPEHIEQPIAAALSVRKAELPKSLRNALTGKEILKEALTFIKPGISIDPATGCTRTDFLRFEEVVRSGSLLNATCTLDESKLNPEQLLLAQALLAAGAAFVERLGAKRRRGVGRCKITLEGQMDSAIKWLENFIEQKQKLPKTPEIQVDNFQISMQSVQTHNDWYYVDLVLQLQLPLLVHKRTVGNVVETLDYLPGTHLLPILSKELRQSNPNIGEAISQGNLLVTHAFLEVEGVRGRPVPLGLFSEKLNKDKFYNLLQVSPSDKPQIKGSRSGYVGASDEFVKLGIKTVNKEVATHNTVDDKVQRPTERVGGVYSYEALSPGTKLRSQLRVRGDLAKNLDWLQSLNRTYRIGRANKDDYGLVELKVDGELTSCSKEKNNVEKTKPLIVWLLSDVLLRDKWLRPTASLTDFKELLEKELKVDLKERDTSESDKLSVIARQNRTDDKLSVIARQNRTESWHNKWGLPRPSLVGLAAGTCIVYEVSGGKLDSQILGALEASGIGERRAEGYGQLCFNDSLLMQNEFTIASEKLPDKADSKSPTISDKDAAFEYAQLIEEQAWRKAIENKALELAAKKENREKILGLKIEEKNSQKKSKPSLSQLGALRSVLAKLQKPNDEGVIKWIEAVEKEKVENRKDKWGESLELIKELVTNSSKVWQHFNLNSSDLTITQSGDETIKSQLWVYAVQVLIDACIRAHKREVENSN